VPPGRLAELTRLTTGGVTVVLDRLEKADVIRREPNPNDRRSLLVHVVPKFLRSAEAAYGKMAEATDALLAQFSDKGRCAQLPEKSERECDRCPF